MLGGEVLYFDDERGTGFISGDDGNRYVFDRTDLPGVTAVSKGAKIQFEPDGDRARGIVTRTSAALAATQATATAVAAPPTVHRSVPDVAPARELPANPTAGPTPALSVWGYFKRAITSKYASFTGRATRKEYWSYVLFAMLGYLVLGLAGLAVDNAVGTGDEPAVMIILVVLFGLAIMLPGLAVTVRRQHDIGLSGWFILLGLIPTFGSLIIIVFALIPSQKHENKWGPVPDGVRI